MFAPGDVRWGTASRPSLVGPANTSTLASSRRTVEGLRYRPPSWASFCQWRRAPRCTVHGKSYRRNGRPDVPRWCVKYLYAPCPLLNLFHCARSDAPISPPWARVEWLETLCPTAQRLRIVVGLMLMLQVTAWQIAPEFAREPRTRHGRRRASHSKQAWTAVPENQLRSRVPAASLAKRCAAPRAGARLRTSPS